MKVRITHLKAPWPAGLGVGDVLELDPVPAWALGKFEPVADDVAETVRNVEPGTPIVEVEVEPAHIVSDAEEPAPVVEQPKPTKAEMVEALKAKGVRVDGRWSDERIAQEFAKAQ